MLAHEMKNEWNVFSFHSDMNKMSASIERNSQYEISSLLDNSTD